MYNHHGNGEANPYKYGWEFVHNYVHPYKLMNVAEEEEGSSHTIQLKIE